MGAWLAGVALALPVRAMAEEPPIGLEDRPPAFDAAGEALFTDALGLPDPRIERWDARRAAARRRAVERGRRALHAFVDQALARAGATPRTAAAVHAALDRAWVETGRRPLVDGGVVVRLEVSLAALREAAGPLELFP